MAKRRSLGRAKRRGGDDEDERREALLEVGLFGTFAARIDGAPLPRLRSRKGRQLLALLALRAGREVERRWLAGTLWPDTAESAALALLRRGLTDLRRALGPAAGLLASPTIHTLRLEWRGLETDVVRFDGCIARGDPEALREAVSLYRGPLLEGWSEEWVFPERQRREEECLRAHERLAQEARAGATCPPPSSTCAPHWRSIPVLMETLSGAGASSAALEIYRELRERLHRDLNAAPDPCTTALFQRIREGRGGDGTNRTECALSPSRPLPPFAPSALLTRFIGRRRETAEVGALLDGHRLLTLTGAGGCGKTRLAWEVSRERAAGVDMAWVELAPLADPALVPATVAGRLEVREAPGMSLLDSLRVWLRPRAFLLLLDNCEHLAAACATLIEPLLRDCPALRVLATSGEPLWVPGEQLYRVPPLVGSEAVQLFVDRAALVDPGFALSEENAEAVAEICRQLDGMPLAIELAAARARALAPAEIAALLSDRFRLLVNRARGAVPRHRTLRAVIDWSYDLLSPAERALLARLSVFAGDWSREAAEAICDADLEVLTALVDRSLLQSEVRAGETRYRLLETVRQYARDRLAESGEAEVWERRHRDGFLALAEQLAPSLRGPEQAVALERLEREHDNFRAAVAWSESRGEIEQGLRLVLALQGVWRRRAHEPEGRALLRRLIARLEEVGDPSVIARALDAAASMAIDRGELAAAREWTEQALDLCRRIGDRKGMAVGLCTLGNIAAQEDDSATAKPPMEESLALMEDLGDDHALFGILNDFGLTAAMSDRFETALALLERARVLACRSGEPRRVSLALTNLGVTAVRAGDGARAVPLLRAGLVIKRDLGLISECIWTLAWIANAVAARGEWSLAARLLAASEGGWAELTYDPRSLEERAYHRRDAARVREALGEAAFDAAWAEGAAMTWDAATEYALSRTEGDAE